MTNIQFKDYVKRAREQIAKGLSKEDTALDKSLLD